MGACPEDAMRRSPTRSLCPLALRGPLIATVGSTFRFTDGRVAQGWGSVGGLLTAPGQAKVGLGSKAQRSEWGSCWDVGPPVLPACPALDMDGHQEWIIRPRYQRRKEDPSL